jgi:NAD(P)-dependent dehydrogenase (short-subunit alcohol dehydrogenase family)
VALVTGATSGIGAATAERLAAEGARVLVTGRDERRGRAVAARLGPEAWFVAADLAAPGAPQRLVEAAVERHGRLDVLVNNAALDHVRALTQTPPEEVRAVFDVNVFAAIALLQAAADAMRAGGGGAIVNVTSRLASVGRPQMGIYAASKGALLALTRSAAIELAPDGIRVNAVAPGMTATPLYDAWLAGCEDPRGAQAESVAGIPQGRVAEPADVAAAIAFLASDDAAHVTGASLPVDGGYTAG